MTITITEPGVYDMPADVYHADPVPGGSLSSSGARKLVPPNCPAKYRWWLDEGQERNHALDFGTATHVELLGVGDPIRVIDADSYRTKAAQAAKDEAYAAGAVPLLAHEHEQVLAMVAAVRRHDLAGRLFDPSHGEVERALFWLDDEFGVWRRALLDKYTRLPDGRLVIVDYKTSKSADPASIQRSVADYGYHQQDPWYCDGAVAVGLADEEEPPGFVFVFQEKTPPYPITIVELHDAARDWGRLDNRRALRAYAECQRTGQWPGYADDVVKVDLPAYAAHQRSAAYDRGDYHPKGTPA